MFEYYVLHYNTMSVTYANLTCEIMSTERHALRYMSRKHHIASTTAFIADGKDARHSMVFWPW